MYNTDLSRYYAMNILLQPGQWSLPIWLYSTPTYEDFIITFLVHQNQLSPASDFGQTKRRVNYPIIKAKLY